MPRYRVDVYYSSIGTIVVNAPTIDEAQEIAEEIAPTPDEIEVADSYAEQVSDIEADKYRNYSTNKERINIEP